MSKTFNQTTTGGSPQVNQGQEGGEATNVTNNHFAEAGWQKPFLELQEQVIDQPWPEETPAEVVEQYATPTVALSAAMKDVEYDLSEEEPIEATEEQTAEAKKTWGETFKAMVPLGIKLSTVALKAGRDAMKTQTVSGAIIDALLESVLE